MISIRRHTAHIQKANRNLPWRPVRRKIEFEVTSMQNPQDFGKVWHVNATVYRKLNAFAELWQAEESLWKALPDSKAWSLGEQLLYGVTPDSGPLYDAAIDRMVHRMKRELVKTLKKHRLEKGEWI